MLASSTHRFARCVAMQNRKGFSAAFRLTPAIRSFSSAPLNTIPSDYSSSQKSQIGFIEKPLKALDLAAVRQIKAELMAVDANSDGR